MRTDEKRSQLLEFAKELKDEGYKVYAPVGITTYLHFVKDGKIGYVERGDYGFNFSTVHKPSQQSGTGFSIHREVYSPTVAMAKDSLVSAPDWASSADRKAVKKYENWGDYTSYPQNKIIPEVEIPDDDFDFGYVGSATMEQSKPKKKATRKPSTKRKLGRWSSAPTSMRGLR